MAPDIVQRLKASA